MQPKDLRKLCGKLREDRLLAVYFPLLWDPSCCLIADQLRHSRQETREGLQRPINRDYYYIDFHATIDAIKYRVLQVTSRVKQMFRPSEEKKDYCCPRCSAQWTQLEVLDNVGPMGFLCHRCGGPLEREEPATGDNTGSEKQVKLAAQLERVLNLLQDIDNATIPKNDFETALALQVPIQRNKDVNPVRTTVPVETNSGLPVAVKGIDQPVVQDLTVDLTSSAEKTATEKASEENRKAAIAAQNALPVWHTQSTVAAAPSAAPVPDAGFKHEVAFAADLKRESAVEDDKNTLNAAIDESDELAAYYARMAQEKEKEEREDREDEASSDDEDQEDEFEDVSINPTPLSSQTNLKAEETADLKPPPSGVKQETDAVSESGSSAPGSAASTPSKLAETISLAAKRVKLEAENGNAVVSDEDEEAEFEDAL